MNKAEALQAMRDGKRIRHRYYSPEEYAYMEGDLIYTEDGYCHGTIYDEFWLVYQKWNEGWSIYKEE